MKYSAPLQKIALCTALSALSFGSIAAAEMSTPPTSVTQMDDASFVELNQVPVGFSLQLLRGV